jgi:hypothetical protein
LVAFSPKRSGAGSHLISGFWFVELFCLYDLCL